MSPIKRGKRWAATPYDPSTKAKRHIGTFDTRREAKDAEDAWRRERKTRLPGRETCDSFANRWVRDYPRPKDRTNRTNTDRVAKFATDFKGRILSDIARPEAREWALKNKARAPAVRAMFTDAMNDGLCTHNPFAGLRLEGSPGRKHLVPLDERGLLELAAGAHERWGAYGPVYEAMVLFAGFTGVRPGELYALNRDDITGSLCVVERAVDERGAIGTPKNGKARTIIVPPPALEALVKVPPSNSGLLFTTPTGKRFTQASHHRYWDAVRCLAGHPQMAFYELRHVAATLLLERGATTFDVSVQLGHTDGGILVATLYGHPSHENARARLLAAFDESIVPTGVSDIRSRKAE